MILVTGATGVVGRPLVDRLVREGAKVRAVTRDRLAADLPTDVEVIEGDPSRPDSIAHSLHGVTSLFLHPRAVGDAAFELVALARERGVQRVVALSATNVDDDLAEQSSRYRGDRNKEAEEAAVGSGLEWTSLRAGYFAMNTLHSGWQAQLTAGDVVRGPYATFAVAPIHERDLVAVAACALLTDDKLVNRTLELTGPQSLTHADMVAIIGEVIGRPLRYEEISAGAAKQGMLAQGFPGQFVDGAMAMYGRGAGQAARVSGEVEKALGRPGLTYADWVADHAAAFGGPTTTGE